MNIKKLREDLRKAGIFLTLLSMGFSFSGCKEITRGKIDNNPLPNPLDIIVPKDNEKPPEITSTQAPEITPTQVIVTPKPSEMVETSPTQIVEESTYAKQENDRFIKENIKNNEKNQEVTIKLKKGNITIKGSTFLSYEAVNQITHYNKDYMAYNLVYEDKTLENIEETETTYERYNAEYKGWEIFKKENHSLCKNGIITLKVDNGILQIDLKGEAILLRNDGFVTPYFKLPLFSTKEIEQDYFSFTINEGSSVINDDFVGEHFVAGKQLPITSEEHIAYLLQRESYNTNDIQGLYDWLLTGKDSFNKWKEAKNALRLINSHSRGTYTKDYQYYKWNEEKDFSHLPDISLFLKVFEERPDEKEEGIKAILSILESTTEIEIAHEFAGDYGKVYNDYHKKILDKDIPLFAILLAIKNLITFREGPTGDTYDFIINIGGVNTTPSLYATYIEDLCIAIQLYKTTDRTGDILFQTLYDADFKKTQTTIPKLEDEKYAAKTATKTNDSAIITNLSNKENLETKRTEEEKKSIGGKIILKSLNTDFNKYQSIETNNIRTPKQITWRGDKLLFICKGFIYYIKGVEKPKTLVHKKLQTDLSREGLETIGAI